MLSGEFDTPAELAEASGVSQKTIADILARRSTPRLGTARKLATPLKVDAAVLLDELRKANQKPAEDSAASEDPRATADQLPGQQELAL